MGRETQISECLSVQKSETHLVLFGMGWINRGSVLPNICRISNCWQQIFAKYIQQGTAFISAMCKPSTLEIYIVRKLIFRGPKKTGEIQKLEKQG